MKKVCIIGCKGSGTTILTGYLNGHPDIEFFDEIFTRNEEWTHYKRKYPTEEALAPFLDDFWHKEEFVGKEIRGFNLKYDNIIEKIEDAMFDYLYKNNIAIIHILRDPQRTFIRDARKGHSALTLESLGMYINKMRVWKESIREHFGDKDYLEVRYEDMTRGINITELPRDFEKRVLKFLGVKDMRLVFDGRHCYRKLKIKYVE